MALLADYALTPDVFDATSYSTEPVCVLCLQVIRDVLLNEGLVRDLRNSEWRRLFAGDHRPWHRRGKELLKKLATQGRLVRFAPALPSPAADDRGWCEEALGTHKIQPFSGGIIVTAAAKEAFDEEPLVAQVDRLSSAPWWARRSPSVRLARTIAEYEIHLATILRCANSIMFIDPHLDPTKYGYQGFGELLVRLARRTPPSLIEVHRVCYEGSGQGRTILPPTEIERRFRDELTAPLRTAGLQIEVFVWDDFHDRFVISNLLGISAPNGFDTTNAPNSITRWTRLGRDDRDDVQREFHPASNRHSLRARFKIP